MRTKPEFSQEVKYKLYEYFKENRAVEYVDNQVDTYEDWIDDFYNDYINKHLSFEEAVDKACLNFEMEL